MMARTRVLLAAALLVGGATACSDLTGNVNADGTFYLQTVNGVIVPYSYTDPNTGADIDVLSDTYALNSDGTYTEFRTWRENGFSQSGTEDGDWTQSGGTVHFTPFNSDFSLDEYQGSVRNNTQFNGSRTLTISINGSTAIYSD